jgi:hypothetical protein
METGIELWAPGIRTLSRAGTISGYPLPGRDHHRIGHHPFGAFTTSPVDLQQVIETLFHIEGERPDALYAKC